jgi:putative transposase
VGVLDASTSPPKERYAVPKDNVTKLIQPGVFDDQLTEVLRHGARVLLARAVAPEFGTFVVIFFVRRRSSFDRRLKGCLRANLL